MGVPPKSGNVYHPGENGPVFETPPPGDDRAQSYVDTGKGAVILGFFFMGVVIFITWMNARCSARLCTSSARALMQGCECADRSILERICCCPSVLSSAYSLLQFFSKVLFARRS